MNNIFDKFMNKKVVIPIAIGALVGIFMTILFSGSHKVELEWDSTMLPQSKFDGNLSLLVYVENSGSMDGYMCTGSELKDAVFDYVSDLKKDSKKCDLYYINSRIIPYQNNLQSYIKDLTPHSFAMGGGDRSNTDLPRIFSMILNAHTHKGGTLSVLVSDCILDIYGNTSAYLGNCQVSMKNIFNEAIAKNADLGVAILKMESKFDGYWFCSKNKEKINNKKRPYYIWLLGSSDILAEILRKYPVDNIIHGVEGYCAYSSKASVPFNFEKKVYVVGRTNKITVPILVDLSKSLQSEHTISNISNYKTSNPALVKVVSIEKITAEGSRYSHVLNLEISNPKNLKDITVSFSYPQIASWVESTNDVIGADVNKNSDKTTGLLSLIKGVADAYNSANEYGVISFKLKNRN